MRQPEPDPLSTKENREPCFDTFYRTTAGRTFAAAYRVAAGDKHQAHDATQEAYCAMLRIWPERRSCPEEDNRKYVSSIAVRKVIDAFRKRRGQVELHEELEMSAEDLGLSNILDEMATLDTVRKIIDRQPERRRAVAVLFFFEELDYQEIAASLSISPSTVRTHVERLRGQLQPLLGQITGGGDGHE